MKTQRRYWTLSTDGNRTPIEIIETIEDSNPMKEPSQQIQQYVQIPQQAAPMQPTVQPPAMPVYQQPAMVRPAARSPIPFFAAGAGLFLCFYSWSVSAEVETLKQQKQTLAQQVSMLQAQNQALKEMAAIVR